jgi:hypothetical protein
MKTNLNSKNYEKRIELKALSKPLRILRNEGAIDSINDGLKGIYKQSGHEELNTLWEWNRLGKQVKKPCYCGQNRSMCNG